MTVTVTVLKPPERATNRIQSSTRAALTKARSLRCVPLPALKRVGGQRPHSPPVQPDRATCTQSRHTGFMHMHQPGDRHTKDTTKASRAGEAAQRPLPTPRSIDSSCNRIVREDHCHLGPIHTSVGTSSATGVREGAHQHNRPTTEPNPCTQQPHTASARHATPSVAPLTPARVFCHRITEARPAMHPCPHDSRHTPALSAPN